MRRKISVLGSTGSVGVNALEVAGSLSLEIAALVAGSNIKLLEEQARRFRPQVAAVFDETLAGQLKTALADTPVRVLGGEQGVIEAASLACEMSISAISGLAGLRPTLAAMEAGNAIGLANKESLVCGGNLISKLASERRISIIPVDSEHSAIFQCLAGNRRDRPAERLILTASGGPFFGFSREQLERVTLQDALKHPTWSMGKKITIDSATMMNKGLEIIEAAYLFEMSEDKIDIIVHRESIIHSMVEFSDGAVLAQLGVPDMKLPIQLAVTWPERAQIADSKRLNFEELGALSFHKPDYETFPCLSYARRALRTGSCVVLNAANEVAVGLFLKSRISFVQISEIVGETLSCMRGREEATLEEIFELDALAREAALAFSGTVRTL